MSGMVNPQSSQTEPRRMDRVWASVCPRRGHRRTMSRPESWGSLFLSLRLLLMLLESVLKPAECRIGADFSVGQGDLTRESWRISSQINAAPAEKGALRRRFDGFKTDSRQPRNERLGCSAIPRWQTLRFSRSSFSRLAGICVTRLSAYSFIVYVMRLQRIWEEFP